MQLEPVLAWESAEVRQDYSTRDTILYALGCGVGQQGVDSFALNLLFEEHLAALPSLCTVLAAPGFWARDNPQLGIDWVKLVHGEQRFELHAPLPPAARITGRTRVNAVIDKGAGKGAIVITERVLHDVDSGQSLATVEQSIFCRGDGGCGSGQREGWSPAPQPQHDRAAIEHTPAHAVLEWRTAPDMAAVYRLSGDLNPLHIDPAIASSAGFERPILHGLATYGLACQLLMRQHGVAASQVRGMGARFSAPVFPGETLRIESWLVDGEVLYRAYVKERDIQVLSAGTFHVAPGGTT